MDEEKGVYNEEDGSLNLNPNSLTVLENCYLEPALGEAEAPDSFQFVRNGYFCVDAKIPPRTACFQQDCLTEVHLRSRKNNMAKRLVFTGDSITDCDRLWDDRPDSLGFGYVRMIAEALTRTEPETEVLNRGHNGFTALSDENTVEEDCISLSPMW